MITDKIADCLTRIRNALKAGHKFTLVQDRNLTRVILEVLQKEGYIESFEPQENYKLKINLKYVDGAPAIRIIERVSKPGCRKYISVGDLAPYFNGLGVNVLSTSKGIISDHQAKKENVGGELLFRVF
ncbi:MAG: 30S ribosomal protein S8 [Alphaproteobacteria bacterium]|nr:MAG: 30S ribosomal protein S8 [Alphaproteobacteria bacterium]